MKVEPRPSGFMNEENGNAAHENYCDLHDGKQMDDDKDNVDLELGRRGCKWCKVNAFRYHLVHFVELMVTTMPTHSTQASVHLNYHNSTAADTTDGFINIIGMEFQRPTWRLINVIKNSFVIDRNNCPCMGLASHSLS